MESHSDKSNKQERHVPSAIKHTFVFFNLITWIGLFISSVIAFINSDNGNYLFLVPVGLYGLNLLFFPRIDYTPAEGWKWQKPLTGGVRRNDGSPWRGIIFLLIEFGLIFWMNQYSPSFISMYFTLFGHSLGIIGWQIGIPLVALEALALLMQNGLFGQTSRIGDDGLVSLLIGFACAIPNILVIVVLIRSRMKSEVLVQELKATKQRLEEALLKEKEVAVLRERDRMAREMHDVLGHALVLVAVKIEAAQRLQMVDPARSAQELEATKELVRQSMADLRASLADLRSPALEADDKPITQALRSWAELTARENRFVIECNFEPEAEKLPAPIQDALWRVGREAILNVVKHARAKRVELNMFCKDNLVYLSVGDDGVGIPHLGDGTARLEVEGHYGVRGMRERLEALGGHLIIKPNREGKGTLVLASIPLPPPQEVPPERLHKRLSPVKGWLVR